MKTDNDEINDITRARDEWKLCNLGVPITNVSLKHLGWAVKEGGGGGQNSQIMN